MVIHRHSTTFRPQIQHEIKSGSRPNLLLSVYLFRRCCGEKMISLTILIPFPVSISICSPMNSLWFPSLLLLCITRFVLFHGWWRCCLLVIHEWWSSYLFFLYSASAKLQYSALTTEATSTITAENSFTAASNCTNSCYDFDLHDDMLVEVLCRLPPKHMVSLKSVSKSWNRLISDVCVPKITSSPLHGLFVRTSVVNSEGNRSSPWHFTCVDDDQTENNTSSFLQSCYSILPFTPTPDCFLDSSNGFLLFIDRLSGRFYVCNPSTEQCIPLPKSPEPYQPKAAALILDPQSTIVYVLLRPLRMVIYSSATREWMIHRRLHLEDSIVAKSWTTRFVSLNGCIYCLSTSGHLLEFDVKQVSARGIKLPNIVRLNRLLGCIGLSEGRLRYAWYDGRVCRTRIWTFHESKWLSKPTVSITRFYKDHPAFEACCLAVPYAFHPTSDILFLGHRTKIYCYHPGRDKLEYVYGAKSGTSINRGQVLIFPFSRNLGTYEESIGALTKNL